MIPIFFPPTDKLIGDVARVTNLCYFAPIDRHRRHGWCTEVIHGDYPRAYHHDGREYIGRGATWTARILDLVTWLDLAATARAAEGVMQE